MKQKAKDDVAVRREEICKLFSPSPGKTAFHDWVNKGRIVKARGMSGFYLLNATRIRLNMPAVDVKAYRREMESKEKSQQQRNYIHLALIKLDSEMAYLVPATKLPTTITAEDNQSINKFVTAFKQEYQALETEIERVHYYRGVLEASEMIAEGQA